jgi:hypothetical protein
VCSQGLEGPREGWVREGDLNSSCARFIEVHFRSSEAVSGVNLDLPDYPVNSIHGHLDTWAAVSDLVSKPPLTAARSTL